MSISPTERGQLDARVQAVIEADLCSGCGGCCLLDAGLEMDLVDGYRRPVRVRSSTASPEAVAEFDRVCPGILVRAPHRGGRRWHPVLGAYVGVWSAAAVDSEIRHAGASGGVLTALSAWLTSTGAAHRVIGATADVHQPQRTVTVEIANRADALAAAGSRYAPVSNASSPAATSPDTAFVGKPCEASAIRALTRSAVAPPLILSFFCAGTPRQDATDGLVAAFGMDADQVTSLRYRGNGWPGNFTVTDGRKVGSLSYDQSWGEHLGPTVQWRCKVCPDGLGESADVVAGDYWEADERGYPVFEERDGTSALVARTDRGRDLIERAIAAGVLTATPVTADQVVRVQPFQRRRRSTVLGRLVGSLCAGGGVPRYRGFRLLRWVAILPREQIRTARDTRRRVLARKPRH